MILKEIINSIYPLSDKSFKMIEDLVENEFYDKGATFIDKNKRNEKEYILLNGICKSYLINPKGEEITITFFDSNTVLSPHTTRTSNGLSILYFKALTKVEFATINSSAFEHLITENSEIREFANTVLRKELGRKVDKEISLASLTAKERLIKFREQFKAFENLIPHTDIASYLGITNVSLSRLRGEKSK